MESKIDKWIRPDASGRSLEDQPGRECAECGRLIPMGEDAIALERIVMGPRGPVPIEDMKFFHLAKCLADYVCDTEGEKLPTRIP